MTFTGSQSAADAALSGMVYTPAANYFGSDSLDMETSDLGHNGPGTQTDSDSTAISIASVADAPVNTVPGAQSAVEDTPLTLGTVSVQDADTANLEVTLDVDHGTLTLPSTTGLSFTTGDGSGDATMVFSGSQPALNDALDGVEYTPTSAYVGSDTLTVTSDDGALSDTDTVAISVQALNKAPVNTVPGAQTVDEDTNLVFSSGNGNAISVADSDAAGDDLRVSLSVGMGGLTLGTTSGLVFTDGDGTGDSSMTFEGTLSELNAALAGLTYRGAGNYNGGDALSVQTNDLGNNGAGGAQSDTDTVNLTVSAVNDGPEHIMPGAQTVAEGGTLTLSTANANRIAVGDADAGSSPMETTLTVDHGALTLASTDGLTFSTGDGTGDATMTFSGARTAINTALDGLQYTPAADYAGAEELSIVTSDLGNTGSGGAKTDSDDLAVTVTAVNDAPTIGVPAGPITLAENGSAPVTVSVADVDAGSGTGRHARRRPRHDRARDDRRADVHGRRQRQRRDDVRGHARPGQRGDERADVLAGRELLRGGHAERVGQRQGQHGQRRCEERQRLGRVRRRGGELRSGELGAGVADVSTRTSTGRSRARAATRSRSRIRTRWRATIWRCGCSRRTGCST
jgi:hypothetical protein